MKSSPPSPKQKVQWHSIDVCPNGHIMVRFGVTTIHMQYEDLKEFTAMANHFLNNCEQHPELLKRPSRESLFTTH